MIRFRLIVSLLSMLAFYLLAILWVLIAEDVRKWWRGEGEEENEGGKVFSFKPWRGGGGS